MRTPKMEFHAGCEEALLSAPVEIETAASDAPWRSPAPSRRVVTAAKIALSVLAIVMVVRTVNFPAAWHLMLQQNPWLAAAAALLMVGQIGLGGLRWHVILRRLGGRLKVGATLRLFYIAVFFNACLWGAVAGDLVRVWLAHRNAVETKIAVNSVLLDRVAPLCAVALLVLATLPLFVARVGLGAALAPLLLSLAGIAAIAAAAQLHRLPSAWQHYRILRLLDSVGNATRAIFLEPSAIVPVLSIAMAAQIAAAVSAYIIARGLAIDVSLLDCIMLMQPVALFSALPISVGGWGVREATIVTLFGLIGVSSEAALALSVQIGLINLLVSLPGGIFWVLQRDSDAKGVLVRNTSRMR
jgi:uncharacterized protein (TIRG00374 family)